MGKGEAKHLKRLYQQRQNEMDPRKVTDYLGELIVENPSLVVAWLQV